MDWIVEHVIVIHLDETLRQARYQVQVLFHRIAVEGRLVLFGNELVLIDPSKSILLLSAQNEDRRTECQGTWGGSNRPNLADVVIQDKWCHCAMA